jgi:colanic acid biosynthesis glycosyl transferase WcaI
LGAKLTASLCGSKAWLHVQDFEVDAAFDLGILKGNVVRRLVMAMESRLMRCFDVVSTISGRMFERLNVKGVQEDRCVLFPNWVDTKAIFPIEQFASSLPPLFQGQMDSMRHELGIPDDAVVVLYSGNMGEKQGLEIVIEAAHILESVHNIRFVMCGQGAAFERLRSLSDGMRNISWLPLQPLERLNELLNLADIHLLPQRSDAADLVMPSKLTGILASGRPVVATAAEGTEVWSVVDGCGVNTHPGDARAFAIAVRELAEDSAMRAMLGKAGRRYAEEYLDTEVVLGRFEDELKQVVEK